MAAFAVSTLVAFALLTNRLAGALPSSSSNEERQLGQCRNSTFTSILPPGAYVEKISSVPRNGVYGEGWPADLGYPGFATKLPPVCAVSVSVRSSPTSKYRFGLFLPQPASWSSNFLAVGNGAFLGGINWPEMGTGPRYGMATMSTDTGHNSGNGDLSWAAGAPEVQADWGWRAVHGSAQLAKRMTEAYYGRKIAHSYWSGCSTGGRQGLKEIQISPDTFDGALIGAPAWDTMHLMPWVTKIGTSNLPNGDPKTITSVDQYSLAANTILRQCDAVDGVRDNIISAPELCDPDLSQIECGKPGVDPSNCLVAGQIQTLHNIMSDYYTSAGRFVHSGPDTSSANQWDTYTLYGNADAFDVSYERYFLYNNASWTWNQFGNGDGVVADSEAANSGNATANDFGALAAFRARGGKIIMYHGLADGVVPARSSGVYYNNTISALGGGSITDFFRYFLVPGMQHCWLTPGNVGAPWMFGGWGQNDPGVLGSDFGDGYGVPGFADAAHDALRALMVWVEKGAAVESIVATAWNATTGSTRSVTRQRPLCPWPRKAVYDGTGNVNAAANWACR